MTATKPLSDMEYRDMIFGKLLKIKNGEQPLNKGSQYYDKYVSTVKEIIERGIDTANNIHLQFSNDYTKIIITQKFKPDTLKSFIKKSNEYVASKEFTKDCRELEQEREQKEIEQ